MKQIAFMWLWVGICFGLISIKAGPEPIVAWLIFTGIGLPIIGLPIIAWVEHDIKRIKERR